MVPTVTVSEGPTVTIDDGDAGPTTTLPGSEATPCGSGRQYCRYVNYEFANFPPGTYTVNTWHDGFREFNAFYERQIFCTFQIAVDEDGTAALHEGPREGGINQQCWINFEKVEGMGIKAVVEMPGEENLDSDYLTFDDVRG